MNISIHKILGLDSRATDAEISDAYFAMMQRHQPDESADEGKKAGLHLTAMKTTIAYIQWKKRKTRKPSEVHHPTDHRGTEADYTLYKTGYTAFTLAWSKQFDSQKGDAGVLLEEFSRELLDSIPKAYYNFALLIDRYPLSQYASDSREKMEKIEKLTPIYEKISKKSSKP